MQGPTGPAPQITASATSGQPGTQPQISVNGTDGVYSLAFTIPQGATGPANGLNAYGGLYSNSEQTLSNLTDPVTITLGNPLATNGVTANGNTITITTQGNYEITYWAVLSDTSGDGNFTVEVANGSATIPGTTQTVGAGTTYDVLVSGSTITSLDANATITLQVSSDDITGGSVERASLSVKKLN